MYHAAMLSFNYHHLYYFWVVAREGSIARACRELQLAQPTISAQLRVLEEAIGKPLFLRRNRGLVLTDIGRTVYRYAEDIFAIGKTLSQVLEGLEPQQPIRLVAGIADGMPKLIAYRFLEAALDIPEPVQITCRESRLDHLLADLAINEVDIVISDAPVPPTIRINAFSHFLGESEVTLFATAKMATAYRAGFPRSLDQAPFLLPTSPSTLRLELDRWFAAHDIHPRIVGEFDDSAMLKTFGQAGRGIFPGLTVLEKEIVQQYHVRVVGHISTIKEQYYGITLERTMKHPAVVAIAESAMRQLVAPAAKSTRPRVSPRSKR